MPEKYNDSRREKEGKKERRGDGEGTGKEREGMGKERETEDDEKEGKKELFPRWDILEDWRHILHREKWSGRWGRLTGRAIHQSLYIVTALSALRWDSYCNTSLGRHAGQGGRRRGIGSSQKTTTGDAG